MHTAMHIMVVVVLITNTHAHAHTPFLSFFFTAVCQEASQCQALALMATHVQVPPSPPRHRPVQVARVLVIDAVDSGRHAYCTFRRCSDFLRPGSPQYDTSENISFDGFQDLS